MNCSRTDHSTIPHVFVFSLCPPAFLPKIYSGGCSAVSGNIHESLFHILSLCFIKQKTILKALVPACITKTVLDHVST